MIATEILWEGTARAVDEATDAWKREEESAARAQGVEDILRGALGMVYFAQRLICFQWDALFSERIRDVRDEGERLKRMAARSLHLANNASALAGLSEAEGYTFGQLPELVEAVDRLKRLEDDLARRWPRLDPEALEKGLAQAARGEFADLTDVYHEFPELQDKADS